MSEYRSYYQSPFGIIEISCDETSLISLYQVDQALDSDPSELCRTVERELSEYFSGTRKTFDIPLNLKGTEFQKKVWNALLDIPYGETRSYKEIAEAIGNPKASRAVGMANNRNPIFIIIPCHRVIGASKKLVGYAGGLEMKQGLLDLEARNGFRLQ